MSLEAKIEELTRAVVVLTEVMMMSGGKPVVNGQPNKSSKVPPQTEPADDDNEAGVAFVKGVQEKAGKAAKPAAAPAATAGTAAATSKTSPKKAADAYAPVKKAIQDAVLAGHRKSIVDVLAEYDAKTGEQLSPDVYAEVLEKVAAITGSEVDLA